MLSSVGIPIDGATKNEVVAPSAPVHTSRARPAHALNGLSPPTNSEIFDRGVVLHGGQYVFDNESNTDTSVSGRSEGCIVVDDRYIDHETGGELIEWLKDGSIGVAHYAGEFTIPA